MNCGIYVIRHIPSGKLYVGSAGDLRKRWEAHRYDLRRGMHRNRCLQADWDEYGPDAFAWEILEAVTDVADLISLEQRWLNDLKPYLPEIGYNRSPTAGSCRGVRHSPETRAKISAALKGRELTDEHRAKLAGRIIVLSPETRAKIGEANRNRVITPEFRAKMSALMKARRAMMGFSPFWAKSPANQKGCVFTDEHRAKLSVAAKARWARKAPTPADAEDQDCKLGD